MKKLKPEALRWNCKKDEISFFKNYETLPIDDQIVGQKRAVAALDMGLKLYMPGYNIYVAGLTGTGKLTTIRRALKKAIPKCQTPSDRCYVYNFIDPSTPLLLTFEAGFGRSFKDDIDEMIKTLKSEIPKMLEGNIVNKEKELIVERYQREEKKYYESFSDRIKEDGFALIQVQEGTYVAPAVFVVIGEEAVSVDYLDHLVKEEKMKEEEAEQKRQLHKSYSKELKDILTKARGLGKDMHQALERLIERSTSSILDGIMDDLLAKYKGDKVRKYLFRLKNHILKNIESFVGKDKKQEGMIVIGGKPEDPFWIYEVNLLIDQSQAAPEGPCPLIEEHNPSYVNLFGAIEYHVGPAGVWSTDFRYIKAGSLLKADGGFLIVNALDILKRPYVWDKLKRVLKTNQLIIQPPEYTMASAPMALKPEPIELSVKVIMIGPSWIYHLLFNYEEDFRKIFKILSDFDTSMSLSNESAHQYASVLKGVCERGKLNNFTKDGLAALIEYGVEDSGDRKRISTRFAHLTDILRESNYWSIDDGSKVIDSKHVEKAIDQIKYRYGLLEEKIQRYIEEGTFMISTKGKRVGQVNGLSVYSLGFTSFGKPTRITASVGVGKAGVINIEREAKLSGPTHNKGVMILGGFMRNNYAQKMPLTLSASIAFEQSYGGVDGDSASSTELYCILSALSGVPITQELAVTGSINQMGDIQPIGGANEKIAGFFDVCKAFGLTGKQGVIIPNTNENNLMLRQDIVDAVKEGKFNIYSISHVNEGIELLMGKKAGERNKKGKFPKDSIHGLVEKRLMDIANVLRKFGSSAKKKDKKTKAKTKPKKKKVVKRTTPKKKTKRSKR